MKKLLMFLLLIPVLACSSTLTRPAPAQISISPAVAAETPPPSPTIADISTTTPSPITTCKVNTDALHLRDSPSVDGLVIAWLIKGDHLTILPELPKGDWVKVQTAGGLSGWINSIYCERKTS